MTVRIPAHEAGIVRVFALSMGSNEARALKDDGNAQAAALGAAPVDPEHVEIFPLADLGDMGLAEYLVEGAGVLPAEIEADRARLAALDGWVMVVYSAAFMTRETELALRPELTLIGSYRQEGVDWSAPIDLSTPSALPHSGPAGKTRPRPSDAAMSGRIALAALAVAFFVVGLMLWVGS